MAFDGFQDVLEAIETCFTRLDKTTLDRIERKNPFH